MHRALSCVGSVVLCLLAASTPVRAQVGEGEPIEWPDGTGADCPFPRSTRIQPNVVLTGRYYVMPDNGADTWYPSWGSDGSLYSPWTDGQVQGVWVQSHTPGGQQGGTARIVGDDPAQLTLEVLTPYDVNATPYVGRYPSASLMYDDVWYYGTYTLDDRNGSCGNWCIQGPFVGFAHSTDFGQTWIDSTHTPSDPIFGESGKDGGKVKFGPVHMVDFGKNMEKSLDGRAYFISHGAVGDSGLANWIGGDAVYLGRVTPTPENMDDSSAFEFYAGGDAWSNDVADAAPILEWPGKLGSAAITYDAPQKVYLMWVSRPHNGSNVGNPDTMLLEADHLTGPWRLVTTWAEFGTQGYFVNSPSKFVSADGATLWILYSANFAGGGSYPPGSGYTWAMQEVSLDISPPEGGIDYGAGGGAGTTGGGSGGDVGASAGAGGSVALGGSGGSGGGVTQAGAGFGANATSAGSGGTGTGFMGMGDSTAGSNTGCACHVAPGTKGDWTWTLSAVGALAAACARRRRFSPAHARSRGATR